jgi:hypothetical protein
VSIKLVLISNAESGHRDKIFSSRASPASCSITAENIQSGRQRILWVSQSVRGEQRCEMDRKLGKGGGDPP